MAEPAIRRIRPEDDPAVARLVRTVMPEFGMSGPGFAIHDPEVDFMSAAYSGDRAAYFVVVDGDQVVGGAGVGPLAGGDPGTCELRKMYFLPEIRGRGLGKRLLGRCLDEARALGFTTCYLETFAGMDAAQALYERFGFQRLPGPRGATGHFGCNKFYELDLRPR